MPRQNATPKQTSGGGFTVETDAVAWTLAHMLNRSCPFDPPGGMIERVDTQLPASQWHLEHLSNLAHGQPLCRHSLSRVEVRRKGGAQG